MTEKELEELALRNVLQEKVVSITECKHFFIMGFKQGYGQLKEQTEKFKKDYRELCNLKDMRIKDLEQQIEKMKTHINCKHRLTYAVLYNSIGLESEDLRPCSECENHSKWELDKDTNG